MPTAKESTIKAGQLMAMIESQGYRCAYSGRELTPETATVDHRLPISRGGLNGIENLAVVHQDVNTAKASMTVEEFVQVCRDVVAWHDRATTAAAG
jgi:5-methylcytosine-specific restriction endonuclease McrA